MGKWCVHASLFIFYQIIIKVAGNQDRHKSLVEFDFGPNQTTHFGVTCPWVTKISHFWTWISLKPAGQSWSNFMCSIIGVGERLHKVLRQIDLGILDSGERSLPFGLLAILYHDQGYRNFEIQIGPLDRWRHRRHTNMSLTVPNSYKNSTFSSKSVSEIDYFSDKVQLQPVVSKRSRDNPKSLA